MVAMGFLAGWLVLALGGAVATVWWSLRLWRRRTALQLPTRAVATIAAAAALVGAGGTVIGLVKAFGAVGGESTEPSQKARMLGEGIAAAMNCTAFGMIVWLPSVIILVVMLRKRGERSG